MSAREVLPGVAAKPKVKGVRAEDSSLRESQARSSQVRASASEGDRACDGLGRKAMQQSRGSEGVKGSSKRQTTVVSGPMRPPAAKQKHKNGAAIAALEGRDLFRKDDWSAIERFATVRLPMYSVAWSTLKGYESCWKHRVAFQYFTRLPMSVEVDTASKRRMVSSWLLTFVALLAYGACYKTATVNQQAFGLRPGAPRG